MEMFILYNMSFQAFTQHPFLSSLKLKVFIKLSALVLSLSFLEIRD